MGARPVRGLVEFLNRGTAKENFLKRGVTTTGAPGHLELYMTLGKKNKEKPPGGQQLGAGHHANTEKKGQDGGTG